MNNYKGRQAASNFAREMAKKMNLPVSDARPSELILLQALDPNANQYDIMIAENEQANISRISRGLADRDAFVAHGIAIGILSCPIVNGQPVFEAGELVYHGDVNVFTGAAGPSGLSEAQQIDALYHGDLTLTTNTKNRLENHPLIGFRRALQTQGGATTTNMQDGSEIVDLGVLVRFGGGDRNRVTLRSTCPIKDLVAGDATRKNYLYLRMDGAVIKGATNKAYLG